LRPVLVALARAQAAVSHQVRAVPVEPVVLLVPVFALALSKPAALDCRLTAHPVAAAASSSRLWCLVEDRAVSKPGPAD
jgi:hypothetical protein